MQDWDPAGPKEASRDWGLLWSAQHSRTRDEDAGTDGAPGLERRAKAQLWKWLRGSDQQAPPRDPAGSLPWVDLFCPPSPHLPLPPPPWEAEGNSWCSQAQTAIVRKVLRYCFKTLNLKIKLLK